MGSAKLPVVKVTMPSSDEKTSDQRQLVKRVTAVVAAVAITVGIVLLRDQIENFPRYGYPAVFFISLIGNATIILPTPSMAVVFGVGGALNPVVVGIVAGLGSAIGELTGYLAGVGGRAIVENRKLYERIEEWMRKYGVLAIFVLGFVPNPAFDIGGMIAGALKMPVWKFLAAAWAGKGLRLVLFALGGEYFFSRFLPKFMTLL
jgi:membrane protein YqaA with SNARE-associated domain